MLKKVIGLNRDDLLLYAGVNLGIFLLLQIIMCVVMALLFPCDAIMVANMLMLAASAILILTCSLGHVNMTFTQAVQFGRSRKNALKLLLGVVLTETAFTTALVLALSWVERHLCPFLWMAVAGADGYAVAVNGCPVVEVGNTEGMRLWIDAFVNLEWWWTPLIIGLAALVGLIGGTIIQRFGSKGGWSVWAAWMVVLLSFNNGVFGRDSIVWSLLLPGFVLALAVGAVWSVFSLLRTTVK